MARAPLRDDGQAFRVAAPLVLTDSHRVDLVTWLPVLAAWTAPVATLVAVYLKSAAQRDTAAREKAYEELIANMLKPGVPISNAVGVALVRFGSDEVVLLWNEMGDAAFDGRMEDVRYRDRVMARLLLAIRREGRSSTKLSEQDVKRAHGLRAERNIHSNYSPPALTPKKPDASGDKD